MGLEGTGGGGDGGGELLSAPGLAQKLEDEGTNEQNANVLNLFLNNTALSGGAPAPITNSVGSIDIATSSVVFNGNFTRERYGRAAVNGNIVLEADRRSLLLDANQTNTQKAQAILGGLEFDSGLSAIQSMSNGDVTGTVTPTNIDSFNRRPDAMYINTARLNAQKRDFLAPAFTGAAEPEYVAAMISQAGGTAGPTNFSEVVPDQTLMNQIAADAAASAMLASHPNGRPQFANSQTAMQELVASQTAMQQVAPSQAAMQEVSASQTAMQEVVASQTAMIEIGNSATARAEVYASETALSEIRPVDQAIAKLSAGEGGADAANFPDMATLAGDATAMQGVAASQTAMQELAASQPGMQGVAASQAAMQELAASQAAMQEVAASQVAINEIGSNANAGVAENTVLNSATATQELKASPLKSTFNRFVGDTDTDNPGPITNQRVLVTSNNNDGDFGQGISFDVDVGPRTQFGSTFITDGANANKGNQFRGGETSFDGIQIN
jgi:hypothetical protein